MTKDQLYRGRKVVALEDTQFITKGRTYTIHDSFLNPKGKWVIRLKETRTTHYVEKFKLI
jgi:hypothetical protein